MDLASALFLYEKPKHHKQILFDGYSSFSSNSSNFIPGKSGPGVQELGRAKFVIKADYQPSA